MDEIKQAIERVADKRHERLMNSMAEKEASATVCLWLEHMRRRWKDNRSLVHFIDALIEGYSLTL